MHTSHTNAYKHTDKCIQARQMHTSHTNAYKPDKCIQARQMYTIKLGCRAPNPTPEEGRVITPAKGPAHPAWVTIIVCRNPSV